ncbi:MAG: hypothetical protein IH838_01170 [Proteobacteria bacterium]|nr:hypothetical protein [Pseudomonadota bacterium]MCH9003876.1 hypothetical protein [Pseudomonadota bacterium]
MNKDLDDIPLSESSVTLKLADIQKRCRQLVEAPDEPDGLSLEDPVKRSDNSNPYDRG